MEQKGILHAILPVEQKTATFRTREFIVKTEEQYPQKLAFTLIKDKCDIIDYYKIGQKITVTFDLKGKEWISPQGETKYFNTFQSWKVQPQAGAENPQTQQSRPENAGNEFLQMKNEPKEVAQPENQFTEEEHDDLPF